MHINIKTNKETTVESDNRQEKEQKPGEQIHYKLELKRKIMWIVIYKNYCYVITCIFADFEHELLPGTLSYTCLKDTI